MEKGREPALITPYSVPTMHFFALAVLRLSSFRGIVCWAVIAALGVSCQMDSKGKGGVSEAEVLSFRGSSQVEDLLKQMTLEDKVGEMTQLTLDMLCVGAPYNLDEPHRVDTTKFVPTAHYFYGGFTASIDRIGQQRNQPALPHQLALRAPSHQPSVLTNGPPKRTVPWRATQAHGI